MTTLEKWGRSIARAALPVEPIARGPWRGAVESAPTDLISPDSAAGAISSNFLYLPRTGTWKRRGGQVIQFDTTEPVIGGGGAGAYGSNYGFNYGGA